MFVLSEFKCRTVLPWTFDPALCTSDLLAYYPALIILFISCRYDDQGDETKTIPAKKNKRLAESAAVTIIVFAFIGLFSLIPVGLGFLNPIGNSVKNFDIYDLVFSRFRSEQPADTNIVLVNIGSLNREGIARQIEIINRSSPLVLGIDILFADRKDPRQDSILSRAIHSSSSIIVLASRMGKYQADTDRYDSLITSRIVSDKNIRYGFTNLPNEDDEGFLTVRRFRAFARYKQWPEHSFAYMVAEKYSMLRADRLVARKNDKEIINYRGNLNSFFFIDSRDLLEGRYRPDLMTNKIVLLGYMGPDIHTKTLEDMFFTPLNDRYTGRSFPDMYGVVIHANIISMIINSYYIDQMPGWLSSIIAVLVCFMSVWIIIWIRSVYRDWFGALFKLNIFLLSILIISLGILLFNAFNYRINLTLTIVAVALGPTCLDLYTMLVKGKIRSPGKIKDERKVKIISINNSDYMSGN